jgi:type IV pilus secretin PilQ/predicted competence protein
MMTVLGKVFNAVLLVALSCLIGLPVGYAADAPSSSAEAQGQKHETSEGPAGGEKAEESNPNQLLISIDANNEPVETFFKSLSKTTGMKFVVRRELRGREITAFLPNVSPEEALDAIEESNELTITGEGDEIRIVKEKKPEEPDRSDKGDGEGEDGETTEDGKPAPEPLVTKVIELKYADAQDMQKAVSSLLSGRGTLQVVEQSGWVGWGFGSGAGGTGDGEGTAMAARRRLGQQYSRNVRSQLLVLRDTEESCQEVLNIIDRLDRRPDQILIAANLIEATTDKLRDIGVDWATGEQGIENSSTISTTNPWGGNLEFRGNILGAKTTPKGFSSPSGANSTFPFNAGMTLLFKKIGGTEYEALLHALHEKANANTLSSPKLLTLDNQMATILVGQRFPILETDVSGTDVTQLTTSLDYYENIGIQLNVIPQIQGEDSINMIIHPVVSQQAGTVAARGTGGLTVAEYPIIDTRESETQVLIEDGQTIGIGGLLQDVQTEDTTGVPILSGIPLLGRLFRRDTSATQKQDLIIFLSAKIIRSPGESSEEQIRSMSGPHEELARELLARAAELQKQGEYDTALRLLQRIPDSDMRLLTDTRREVQQRIRELKKLRKHKRREKGGQNSRSGAWDMGRRE